jgi:hypothetical protein
VLTRTDILTNTHLVAAPQKGAAWFIPLDVGSEVTGAGWGQSGYVVGQGPWGYGSHPIY